MLITAKDVTNEIYDTETTFGNRYLFFDFILYLVDGDNIWSLDMTFILLFIVVIAMWQIYNSFNKS
jgi:multisubunit Na+/H+ antiporter MnhG subunit